MNRRSINYLNRYFYTLSIDTSCRKEIVCIVSILHYYTAMWLRTIVCMKLKSRTGSRLTETKLLESIVTLKRPCYFSRTRYIAVWIWRSWGEEFPVCLRTRRFWQLLSTAYSPSICFSLFVLESGIWAEFVWFTWINQRGFRIDLSEIQRHIFRWPRDSLCCRTAHTFCTNTHGLPYRY